MKTSMRRGKSVWGLQKMAQEKGGGILVEVGSYSGESMSIFAGSNKFSKIYCVDPWDISKIPFESISASEQFYKNIDMGIIEGLFDQASVPYPYVEKMKMKSEEAAPIINFQVDMVYIDAIHTYEFVKQDIELWAPKVKSGGWICGHDYSQKFPGVIQAVNEAFGIPLLYEDTSWVIQAT